MNRSVGTVAVIAALMTVSGCAAFKSHGRRTPSLGERVPILASENAIDTDKAIADVQVLLPPAAPNDSWTQPGGNAAKSMGHLALADAPSRAWTATIPGGSPKARLAAAPVVSDGKMYIMDVTAAVHAFDAKTGARLWTQAVTEDHRNRAAHFGGGVSVDGDKLFATDGIGEVVAMAAKDGKVLWHVKTAGPLRGAPALAYGTVYALSQDNQLVALSQETGAVQWTVSASIETQGVFGVAAPAIGRGTLVAGFSSGELNAYRYENGRTLWQDTLSRTIASTSVSSLADIDAAPVIDENRVYAVGQGGRMVSLELTTGRRVWEQNIAGISTPWLAGEWLFVVTDDAKMICLSRGTGKVRWISDLGGFANMKKRKGQAINWVGPVLAGGRLVTLSSAGTIAYVSPADGKVEARIKGSGPFALPPIVVDSTLYVIDQKGKITAYR